MTDIDYATNVRKERRKGKNGTAEFFTPSSIVNMMCDKVPEEYWADSSKTFLEPCFGNGNFVLEIISRRMSHGINWEDTLSTTYGVELMEDNVNECKERILSYLNSYSIDYQYDRAIDIMNTNLVCSDFFKWDFENWCSYEI